MRSKLKEILRPHYHNMRWSMQRLLGIAPSLPVSANNYRLIRLGSAYGGWTFYDDPELNDSVIVSCGLGEDASFDVEFARKYGATVVIVDPTPRAVRHFLEITSRLGHSRQQAYSTSGRQAVESYDLSGLTEAQLHLCTKALWNINTEINFYLPRDPEHVSHSIINYQNNYSNVTSSIKVATITIGEVLSKYNIRQLPLLKLDIEGAEIEVLSDMLASQIFPKQILVEFDELSVPSRKSKARIETVHTALINAGYHIIVRDHINIAYLRQA